MNLKGSWYKKEMELEASITKTSLNDCEEASCLSFQGVGAVIY